MPAAPPVWSPLACWAVLAAAVTVAVLGGVRGPGRLDGPDPAYQRTGLLCSLAAARSVASLRLAGDPIGRRPVVLVFDRRLPDRGTFARFLADAGLPRGMAVVQVVPRPPRSRPGVLGDPAGTLARRVGLARPNDGGPPVGYALIDRRARVRYATLDPRYPEHGFELRTLAGAIA